MRLRLEAEPDEIIAKGETLIEQLAHALEGVHPELADRLQKAMPAPDATFDVPVLESMRARFNALYAQQMKAMTRDISRVLDHAVPPPSASPRTRLDHRSKSPRGGNSHG